MNRPGYVYILTNPAFHDDWVKIGKSSRPVDVRCKELDNTAAPLPFEIYATLKTRKYSEVEKLIHKTIDRLTDLRIRQNREFFNVEPAVALDILRDIAATLDDAEVLLYKDNKPLPNGEKPAPAPEPIHRRPNFKFSMAGIAPDEYVTFVPTQQKVRVADENKVEFEGRLYTLTAFAGTFMPEDQRVPSEAYQGPLFFTYHGKRLTDLRDELEREALEGEADAAPTQGSLQL